MDVLRPQIVTFDGRNYRKNPIQEKQYQHEEDEDFYPDSMEYSDEPCGAYEVAQTPHGFRATVSAPSLLYNDHWSASKWRGLSANTDRRAPGHVQEEAAFYPLPFLLPQ
ncbi:activating signal cointegrator 1 complex subunit 1, isoform CRA_b [Mus musculus]|nr:activating signal cointegrator 1 complex subunit 1, isoform CRA_b [Mus musculus]